MSIPAMQAGVIAPPKPPKQDPITRDLERKRDKALEEAKDKPLKERELKDHLIIASDILTAPPVVMHANGTGSKLNMYA